MNTRPLVALLLALAFTAPAQAATVEVADGVMTYTAAAGEVNDVALSSNGAQVYLTRCVVFGNAFHVQGVGKDQAFEAQLALQHVGDGVFRKGRWQAGLALQGRYFQVGYHGALHTGADKFAEGV